jgi:hypothetical protein
LDQRNELVIDMYSDEERAEIIRQSREFAASAREPLTSGQEFEARERERKRIKVRAALTQMADEAESVQLAEAEAVYSLMRRQMEDEAPAISPTEIIPPRSGEPEETLGEHDAFLDMIGEAMGQFVAEAVQKAKNELLTEINVARMESIREQAEIIREQKTLLADVRQVLSKLRSAASGQELPGRTH